MVNKYEQAAHTLLTENFVIHKYFSSGMSGRAWLGKRIIRAPQPKSPRSFQILAHEVGHIVQGNIKPQCLEEYGAEVFSFEQMKRFGFKIPKRVKDVSDRHISYGLAQALNRGIKKVPAELKPYMKFIKTDTIHTVGMCAGERYSTTKKWYHI